MGKRLFVNPLACKCVINVRNGNSLSRKRDLISLKSVGIASSVVALVVPAADLVSCFYKRVSRTERKTFKHRRSNAGVGLHYCKFLVGQPARLVENTFRNGNFSYIMKRRSKTDNRYS